MIKTLIFDIGKVVVNNNFPALYIGFGKRIDVDPETIAKYHKDNLDDILLGKIDLEKFWEDMKSLGANPEVNLKQAWLEAADEVREINIELLNKIDEWRKDYTLITLTNVSESRVLIDEQINLYSHFDFAFLSCREHLQKPDPKFYQLALDAAEAKPNEAVFVDDNARLVEAANQLGIHGIQFTDNKSLFNKFRGTGI